MKKIIFFFAFLLISLQAQAQWTYVALRPQPSNHITNRWTFDIGVMDTSLFVCSDVDLYGYGINNWNGNGWFPVYEISLNNSAAQFRSAGGLSWSKPFVGTIDGLYASTNNGDNWSNVAFGVSYQCAVEKIFTLPGRLIISTCNGVYTSTSNGIFWTHLNNGIVDQNIPELVYVSDTLLVAVCTYPQKYVYHSTNMGGNWIATPFNIPQPPGVFFGPAVYHRNNLFISQSKWTPGSGAPLYRTGNFGADWDSVSAIKETDVGINSFLGYNNSLFAATDSGVFRSTNLGHNWDDVSGGVLKDSLGVSKIVVYRNFFYAAHRMKGIYKASIDALVSIDPNMSEIPIDFDLAQNYPNPFNPSTLIKYSLPSASFVKIKIFDILGREVGILVNETKKAGSYEIKFEGSKLASGVYFYKMEAVSDHDGIVYIKKMILLK